MDFHFVVDQFILHAARERTFTSHPGASQREDLVTALRLELSSGGESKDVWLLQGETVHVALGGKDYHLVYGLENRPLGFQIFLKDFLIETNPGTTQPASFKSEVTLKDAAAGVERDQTSSMNRPLVHRGFKVYQSAYRQTPGERDISIFTVARDPGNPLKYAGAIILVAGIATLFYVKPLSSMKSGDPKLRRK
jgi:cytochrome c biogenesis protein ResB